MIMLKQLAKLKRLTGPSGLKAFSRAEIARSSAQVRLGDVRTIFIHGDGGGSLVEETGPGELRDRVPQPWLRRSHLDAAG